MANPPKKKKDPEPLPSLHRPSGSDWISFFYVSRLEKEDGRCTMLVDSFGCFLSRIFSVFFPRSTRILFGIEQARIQVFHRFQGQTSKVFLLSRVLPSFAEFCRVLPSFTNEKRSNIVLKRFLWIDSKKRRDALFRWGRSFYKKKRTKPEFRFLQLNFLSLDDIGVALCRIDRKEIAPKFQVPRGQFVGAERSFLKKKCQPLIQLDVPVTLDHKLSF